MAYYEAGETLGKAWMRLCAGVASDPIRGFPPAFVLHGAPRGSLCHVCQQLLLSGQENCGISSAVKSLGVGIGCVLPPCLILDDRC